jgi:hypothetical protein
VNGADNRFRARFASGERAVDSSQGASVVADLLFVVITVVLFAALAVLIRAVERW